MEIITKSAKETREFGKKFSASLKTGSTIALIGDLGAGKTTFIQGLADGLGIKSRITSPTFILMKKYIANNINLYHADLYRLEKDNIKQELETLGLTDFWNKNNNENNIVVIEWAEKAKEYLPKNVTYINFKNISEACALGKNNNTRKINIK